MMRKSFWFWAAFPSVLVAAPAQAVPLSVVNVSFPAVNCVFNPTCKITVTDSVGNIPLPAATGPGRLQSRTFKGVAGTHAAGKTGYMYRVNLTQPAGLTALPCVSAIKVNFGPVAKLQYNAMGPLDDVFVGTGGGLGSIGLSGADQVGNVITFTFSAPVCAGSSPGNGQTSFFFGLASAKPPKAITAMVERTIGGPVGVPARAPNF
jgi:hypothetical protein